MEDPDEAKQVVEDIRSGLVGEGGDLSPLGNIAQNSVRMLSEELYSKKSRFFLELIQNADDNQYDDGVTPKLSVVYRTDGFLWFGCNERGFTAANLRALCSISESTKKVEGNRKGYIGEKGIGFKSVFKVADVVWIKSGALSFKFDKNMPLGMIAPLCCDFNSNELMDERTMFCFRIPEIEDQGIVRKDVSALEAELLLFLRQLKSIHITIQAPNGTIETSHHLQRIDDFTTNFRITELLHRSEHAEDDNEETTSEKFVVCCHTAKDMPSQKKREGVSESDLLVAFPVDDALHPQLRSRHVHNFLPIRAYGFPFVLQADFVLAASREDIQQDIPWNQALVTATRQLFIESVTAFNQHGILQYTWPQYLKSQPDLHDTIFAGFFDSLVQHLRRHPVLQSETFTLERPADLQCVRPEFTDGVKPLLPGSSGLRSFAHHAYRWEDLSALNVRQQSAEQFISSLHDFIKRCPTDFQQQPPEWHSKLAAAITAAGADTVRALNIIPLRKGKWVSAKTKKLFFPELGEGATIPKGIEVEVIDDDAAKDHARKRLYLALGVSTLDEAKVFELILQQHARHQQSRPSWSVEDVVEHAWFIFRARSYPREFDIKKLLVASRDEQLRSGKDVYMDTPDSMLPLSKFLGQTISTVHYLNDEYYEVPGSQLVDDPNGPETLRKKWLKWLHDAIGVRTVPRLAVAGGISREFETIMASSEANEWLELLKDEWDTYALDLQAGGNDKLKAFLTSSSVLCLDGKRRPLKDVYFPARDVLSEPLARGSVPIVAVKDAYDEDWRKLGRSLHMKMGPDGHMFVDILIRMKDESCDFVVDDVKRMQDFRNKALVYIPTARPSKWVSLFACRWTAPRSIITLHALHERYRGNAELFRHKLHLQDYTAKDVVLELAKLSGKIERIDEIRDLLRLLASFVEKKDLEINSFPGLTKNHVKILPVRRGDELELQAFFGDSWFIANDDKPVLVEDFEGLVFFVDLELAPNSGLRKIFEHLGLLDRLLDRQTKYGLVFPDEGHLLDAQTELLRSKAEYLARIAEMPRREESMKLMQQSQVSVADIIVKRKYVMVNGRMVYGSDERASVALQAHPSWLQIWITTARFTPGRLPFTKFSKELATALGIPGRNHHLVNAIFEDDDPVLIQRELEEADYGRPFVPEAATAPTHTTIHRSQARVYDLAANSRNRAVLTRGSAMSGGSRNGDSVAARRPARIPWTSNTQPNGYYAQGQSALNGSSQPRLYSAASFRSQPGRRNGAGRTRTPECSQNGGSSAYQGADNNVDISHLNLALMHSALRTAFAEEDNHESSSLLGLVGMNSERPATTSELAIGSAGEKFVYEVLKQDIGIGNECWTSAARASYGLGVFDGDEAECADFTITEPTVSAKFAEWLLKTGADAAAEWVQTPKIFHIEVKTTNGGHEERFEMSNNQVRLIKQWHFSPGDEMVIVRVHHIGSSPGFRVYVDPYQLWRENVLTFESKTGFYVGPT